MVESLNYIPPVLYRCGNQPDNVVVVDSQIPTQSQIARAAMIRDNCSVFYGVCPLDCEIKTFLEENGFV